MDAGGDPRPGGLNKTGRGVTIFVDGEEQSRLELTLAGRAHSDEALALISTCVVLRYTSPCRLFR